VGGTHASARRRGCGFQTTLCRAMLGAPTVAKAGDSMAVLSITATSIAGPGRRCYVTMTSPCILDVTVTYKMRVGVGAEGGGRTTDHRTMDYRTMVP